VVAVVEVVAVEVVPAAPPPSMGRRTPALQREERGKAWGCALLRVSKTRPIAPSAIICVWILRIASKWSEVCETLDGVMSRRLRSARIASSCSPADVGDAGVRCGVT